MTSRGKMFLFHCIKETVENQGNKTTFSGHTKISVLSVSKSQVSGILVGHHTILAPGNPNEQGLVTDLGRVIEW